MKPGVYTTKKKDGTVLYRASITSSDKHISLGSFGSEALAHSAYLQAKRILAAKKSLTAYMLEFQNGKKSVLPFDKVVMLVNLRDNNVYIKTPIYLEKRAFSYYYSPELCFKFDVDDLFYYSTHKIMKRGGHLFVADYGMQVNILSRYGIKNFAVLGRDYRFVNGDETDMRYANIEIINHYHGVIRETKKGIDRFVAKIHVNGDIVIGRYQTEEDAAIAYNKAAMILKDKGINKDFPQNYIDGISEIEYASRLSKIRISDGVRKYSG